MQRYLYAAAAFALIASGCARTNVSESQASADAKDVACTAPDKRHVESCLRCFEGMKPHPTTPNDWICPVGKLHSWQEIYISAQDAAEAKKTGTVCEMDPFVRPRAAGAPLAQLRFDELGQPTPADTSCEGKVISEQEYLAKQKPGVASSPAAPAASAAPAAPATSIAQPPKSEPAIRTIPVAPSVPTHTYLVKTSVARTHIKTDHTFQGAKIWDDAAKLGKTDPRVCELKPGEALPVSTVLPTRKIGPHIHVKLFEAKCSFKAGAAVFLYAEHFSNVPKSELDFMNKNR